MDPKDSLTQGPKGILKEETYKLVLLGASGVGKTSLARRFANLEHNPWEETTIGCAFFERTIYLDDTRVVFSVWDTAGQERYRSLTPMYCRGAHSAVVVYDITEEETFHQAKSWVEQAKEQASPNVVVSVVANKADKAIARQVDHSRGVLYASENGLLFVETSALVEDISEVLLTAIAEKLSKKVRTRQEGSTKIFGSSGKRIADKELNKRESCCSIS